MATEASTTGATTRRDFLKGCGGVALAAATLGAVTKGHASEAVQKLPETVTLSDGITYDVIDPDFHMKTDKGGFSGLMRGRDTVPQRFTDDNIFDVAHKAGAYWVSITEADLELGVVNVFVSPDSAIGPVKKALEHIRPVACDLRVQTMLDFSTDLWASLKGAV